MRNFILCLVVLFAVPSWSLSREAALKASRANLHHAVIGLYDFVSLCWHYEAECGIVQFSPENQVLHYIQRELQIVQGNTLYVNLEFDSEALHPGTFLLDGQVRLAKTGSVHGAPIVYNEDMMVVRQVDGSFQPLEVPQFVISLVHELGHHQARWVGFPITHEFLDGIGLKVMDFVTERTRLIRIPPAVDPRIAPDAVARIRLVDIDYLDAYRSRFTLIFSEGDSGATYEWSHLVAERSTCRYQRPWPQQPAERPRPFKIFLESIENVKITSVEPDLIKVSMDITSAAMMCAFSNNTYTYDKGYGPGSLALYFKIDAEGRLVADHSRIDLTLPVPPDDLPR